jgi:F0F1-type ATP synthase membrane subunit c/vacuolar-type H+-ATPase subunit K
MLADAKPTESTASDLYGPAGACIGLALSCECCHLFPRPPTLAASSHVLWYNNMAGVGAAYGTYKNGVAIMKTSTTGDIESWPLLSRSDALKQASTSETSTTTSTNLKTMLHGLIPVIMSGVLALYGVIIAYTILISERGHAKHLISGSIVGVCNCASGVAIGRVGEAAIQTMSMGKSKEAFAVGVVILIFGEALGLYGLIAGMMIELA